MHRYIFSEELYYIIDGTGFMICILPGIFHKIKNISNIPLLIFMMILNY
ncbi:hypothetical protein GMMP15_370052 [Candidatus Magnetomoraceae bacterium gMMP-15]